MDDGFRFADVAFFFAIWVTAPLLLGAGAVLWMCLRDKT